MINSEGKYIYCIIKTPKSFGVEFCGVGGGQLHLISSGELAAVVSDSPIMDYPITRENTITHQRAIEEVMRAHSSVLPVSFGTVSENKTIVGKKLLELKRNELLDAMQRIEGKVELNLKAIWRDMPHVLQKVVAENPDLASLKKEFAGRRLNVDSVVKVGKLVEDGLRERRNRLMDEILLFFGDIVADQKDTQCFGEQMIFNVAVLIPQVRQKAFDKIARDLDERYKEEKVYFKYIGPMPPFNFVKVPISLV